MKLSNVRPGMRLQCPMHPVLGAVIATAVTPTGFVFDLDDATDIGGGGYQFARCGHAAIAVDGEVQFERAVR